MPTDEEFAALRSRVDDLTDRVIALEPPAVTAEPPGWLAAQTGGGFFVGADIKLSKAGVLDKVQVIVHKDGVPIAVNPVDWTNEVFPANAIRRFTATGSYPSGGLLRAYTRYQHFDSEVWVNGPESSFTLAPSANELTLTLTPVVEGIRAGWTASPPQGKTVQDFTPGRNGQDNTGYGPWSANPPLAPTISYLLFDKLLPTSDYEITLTMRYTDGSSVVQKAVARPLAPSSGGGGGGTTPQPGARLIPHPGKSGLPFPSIQFNGTYDLAALRRDGDARRRPYDGIMYFSSRGSWDALKSWPSGHKEFLAAGNLVVVRVPIAPESEGDIMNQKGAQDAYRSAQLDWANSWVKAGANSDYLVISVGWEFNGNWYRWSANRGGGPANFRRSIANYIRNMKEGGLDKVHFDQCMNKGPSQAGADFSCILTRDEGTSSVSVDHYDWYGPIRNNTDYQTELNRSPSFRAVRDHARARGQMWGLAEGGNCHHSAGAGDNPFYWQKIREFFFNPDNYKDVSFHTIYNHPGAPASLQHQWSANPRSFEYVRQGVNFGGF